MISEPTDFFTFMKVPVSIDRWPSVYECQTHVLGLNINTGTLLLSTEIILKKYMLIMG